MGIPLKWRRTKAKYLRWFDDPTLLGRGTCEVIAFPNGANELWVRSNDGRRGMRVTFSDGAAGLMVQVDRFALGRPLTVSGNADSEQNWAPIPPKGEPLPDFDNVCVVQYKPDDWSQRFKSWYAGTGDYPEDWGVSE